MARLVTLPLPRKRKLPIILPFYSLINVFWTFAALYAPAPANLRIQQLQMLRSPEHGSGYCCTNEQNNNIRLCNTTVSHLKTRSQSTSYSTENSVD